MNFRDSTEEDAVNKSEASGGILVFLFGAVTAYLSLRMPIGNFRAAGPGLFPLCLGALLMLLSSIFVLKILIASGLKGKKETRRIMQAGPARRVTFFLGAIVLTILFFQPLGYPLSSFLLLLFLMRILGVKPWYRGVLISFSAAFVCYLLFVQWLKIPLPKGWIGL
jgi:putative tricarboxylic transport membrane protein